MQTKWIRVYHFYNLKTKTNPNEILSKNLLKNKLIRFIYKLSKLITKISNKMQKLKTYNKVIYNNIYKNRWYDAIDKKL